MGVLYTVEEGVLHEDADLPGVGVEGVEAGLVGDPHGDEKGEGHAHGQAEDVDRR